MPQDELLFSVTGKELVELGYIGEEELRDLGNAHLDKSGVIQYFVDQLSKITKKPWVFDPEGSGVSVFPQDHSSLPRKFHYIAADSKSSIKRFPKGTFYATHSKDTKGNITIEYYEKC